MKKYYLQPSMNVVTMKTTSFLCGSKPYATTASGNAFGGDILGGSGSGRSRECDWDDEW